MPPLSWPHVSPGGSVSSCPSALILSTPYSNPPRPHQQRAQSFQGRTGWNTAQGDGVSGGWPRIGSAFLPEVSWGTGRHRSEASGETDLLERVGWRPGTALSVKDQRQEQNAGCGTGAGSLDKHQSKSSAKHLIWPRKIPGCVC